MSSQLALFGRVPPAFDPGITGARHMRLDRTAWIDYAPSWLRGHERLFDELRERSAWRDESRIMYDREVAVPRLVASYEPASGPRVVLAMSAALSERYRLLFDRVTMALYRGGADSVAWHGDRVGGNRARAIVAIVSLGEPRRFLVRPKGGGRSIGFRPGWGDLIVMGGTAQRDWEHAVPKQQHAAPRIAVMFRHAPIEDPIENPATH